MVAMRRDHDKISSETQALAFSDMMSTRGVAPKDEIRESSNRTKRARHEHSFPREEITAQAQKTMKTRTGFVFPVLTKSLSRQRCVPGPRKPMQKASAEPRTTGKIRDTWSHSASAEDPVPRRGIE